MKIRCSLALCLLTTPFTALAFPMTWHDSGNFSTHNGSWKSTTQMHTINYNSFSVPTEWILKYQTSTGTHDDRAIFNTEDSIARQSILNGFSLNFSALLNASVESLRDDFFLESFNLWAVSHRHDGPTNDPEMGSLALSGLGLVGLGFARRRLSR